MKLTPEQARKLFRYDSMTGLIWWRERASGRRMDRPAGCVSNDGYVRIRHGDHIYKGQNLAWAIVKGKWPDKEIDHIDTVAANNAWKNLRDATREQNMRNTNRYKNSTSGFKGVSFHKKTGLWQSRIFHQGKSIYLGVFSSPELASTARNEAASKYHGEFARS